MRFVDLVAAYEKLGATKKRLELRKILVELISNAPRSELPEILYLSQGMLRPEYEGVELGLADSLVRRALVLATGAKESEVALLARETGDLGTTAERLVAGRSGTPTKERSVQDVYRHFQQVASSSGEGSQETKIRLLAELVEGASPIEAKYAIRFAMGQLRLGIREMSLLDALAEAFADGSKEARTRLEGAYNLCSDLGIVASTVAASGLEGLSSIHLSVGRPIRPMLAERSPDLTDVLKRMEGRAALEFKYDGLRIQAHIPAEGSATLFSRRLENITGQFPELVRELPKAIRHRPAIVEGECVAVDLDTDELEPFQEISRRRGRKYDLERMETEVPVRLFLFDVLLEGKDEVLAQDFADRRARLEKLVTPTDRVRLATQKVVENLEQATKFFDLAIAEGCEGVMAKSLAEGSSYRAGARGFWWIKYKREYTHTLGDTIDGVVVGGFFGRGRRAGTFGALLMATYDKQLDRFESFCKVGSGFDDATLAELPQRLKSFEVDERPQGVETGLEPDRWIRPSLVLELRGAELSLSPIHRAGFGKIRAGTGLALRFPRFTGRFRDDKSATEATESDELLRMYRIQPRHSSPESPAA
ncbi:MAG TPA: ATP-dependent DNA ligase [Thermoplasmata archaeon]|nr:ATP-dependent DNA ligase [Thermoplasmata archaeon]